MLKNLLRRAYRSWWVQAALLVLALSAAPAAQAQAVCDSFNMDSVNFGSFSPFESTPTTNGTLSFRCYNNGNWRSSDIKVALCFHIGTGTAAGANWNPRITTLGGTPGATALQFQIYQEGGSTIWGSRWSGSLPPAQSAVLTLPPRSFWGAITYVNSSVSYNAAILPNQNLTVAGSYTNSFPGGHTEIVGIASSTNTPNCLGASSSVNTDISGTFPFSVSATVTKYCEVSALDMDFGAIDALATGPVTQTTNITTRCTKDTPYQIALEPGGTPTPTGGSGTLRSASTLLSNPDTYVSYGLFRNASFTQPWGNAPGSNTSSQTGSGINQITTVYGRISNVNVIPDTYSDTVTVKVSY